MEDYKVLLGAILDANAKGDIDKQLNAIKDLSVTISKATLNSEVINDIKNQLSQNGIDLKLVFGNVDQITNEAKQAGQQIGNSLNKSLQSSLNTIKQNINNIIKDFKDDELKSYDLSKMFNLNRKSIDSSVVQQVRNLTHELNLSAKEVLKTNSNSSWDEIIDKIKLLSDVLTQFGTTRDLTGFKESLDVLDYFQNKKIYISDKSESLINTGSSIRELNNEFRNLGVTFTTVSEGATKLDTIWSELFTLSPNLQQYNVFGDQLNAIVEHFKVAKEALYGDKNLQPLGDNDAITFLIGWLEKLENASKKVNVLREEQAEIEQRISQSSTSSTNTVIQNEKKKQQAYKETLQVQKQINESDSLIKSGANVKTYDNTNNAARKALNDFRELLKEENAVISVSEKFGELNGLTSFTVNVKRATGEVESLKYALKPILDSDGNDTGEFYFGNIGAELNNSGAVKQIQDIENAFTDYTQKLAQFKSTNTNILSGLTTPLQDFEKKLADLKNGTSTINEVRNSFKFLGTEASKIVANFTGQLSKIDAAIRKLSQGDEIMDGLKASFKGLTNAPKDINTELSKVSKLLKDVRNIESTEGRTANWSAKYREWSDEVDRLKAKLSVLQKQQASMTTPQIFKTSELRDVGVAYMTKVSNTIEKQMAEIQKMANAHNWKLTDVKGIEDIDDIDGKIKSLTITVREAEGTLKQFSMQRAELEEKDKIQTGLMQVGDIKVIETATQAQEKLAQSTEKTNAKLAEQQQKLADDIQLSMEGKGKVDYNWQVDEEIKKLKSLGFTEDEVSQKVKALTDAHTELKNVINSNNFDTIEAKNKAIIELDEKRSIALNQVKNAYKELKTDASQYYNLNKQTKLSTDIQNWLSKNSRASKDAKQSLQDYYRELSSGRVSVDRLNYIEKELKTIDATQRGLSRLGKSLTDQFKQVGESFTQWLSISSGIMFLVSKTKNAVSELVGLDSILTEISKTSNLTNEQLQKLGDSAFEKASKYGRTASDYLTGVQEMYRAGFENAEEMAELSILAQSAGDMESNSANDYLMATNAAYGFKGSVEELNKVLDSQNFITNNAAVSMQDMADATSEAASIASEYGVGIDELSALIAVVTSKTRESGSEVGNALKSIFVTLQDTTSKPVVEAFDSVGISMTKIVDGAERLKTPIELLKELSVAFNELPEGDTKRANILTDIGKKYHANTLSSILDDWSEFENMLNLYSQGAGSAAKEAEKSANNIQGSLNKLHNSWTDTIENIANSDAILTIINAFNSLLFVINKVTGAFGSLGTIGLGAGIFAGVKNIGKYVRVYGFQTGYLF